ncbi:hypothetical protein F4814DRAFT_450056 [Daldinia grandis]|nr:hypothetical protein F4814DRAFT_450056 [Daldinia grandis]
MPIRYVTIDPACVQRSVPHKRSVQTSTPTLNPSPTIFNRCICEAEANWPCLYQKRTVLGVAPNSPHSGNFIPKRMVTRSPLADRGLARSLYRGLMCSVAFGVPPNPARRRTLKQIKGAAPNHVLSQNIFDLVSYFILAQYLPDTAVWGLILLQCIPQQVTAQNTWNSSNGPVRRAELASSSWGLIGRQQARLDR